MKIFHTLNICNSKKSFCNLPFVLNISKKKVNAFIELRFTKKYFLSHDIYYVAEYNV